TSLGEFFSCGCVLQNRSLFSRIALLPGGSQWEFPPLRKRSYFSKDEWEQQAPVPTDEYYRELKATFARVLPAYVNGALPVGISLTGGLDSRMILAWAGKKLPCYT